jgi:hypothetical protein
VIEYRVDWPTMHLEVIGSAAPNTKGELARTRDSYTRVVEVLWGASQDLSAAEIADRTGVAGRTARDILARMATRGEVFVHRAGRRVAYRAIRVSIRTPAEPGGGGDFPGDSPPPPGCRMPSGLSQPTATAQEAESR